MEFMVKINYTNILYSELTALMQGLRMSASNNFMSLEVNIDSTEVIHNINKGNLIYETIYVNAGHS